MAPAAFSGSKSEARTELEERCRDIGMQLLDDNPRHDREWRAKRALGYGNEAFTVVFPYNTPTQTLTCLWKSGKVDGVVQRFEAWLQANGLYQSLGDLGFSEADYAAIADYAVRTYGDGKEIDALGSLPAAEIAQIFRDTARQVQTSF